jgi:hypothetical protein
MGIGRNKLFGQLEILPKSAITPARRPPIAACDTQPDPGRKPQKREKWTVSSALLGLVIWNL